MTSTLGYTAGIAERMYNEFVDGTYLDVETYKNITDRQQAVDKFTGNMIATQTTKRDLLAKRLTTYQETTMS